MLVNRCSRPRDSGHVLVVVKACPEEVHAEEHPEEDQAVAVEPRVLLLLLLRRQVDEMHFLPVPIELVQPRKLTEVEDSKKLESAVLIENYQIQAFPWVSQWRTVLLCWEVQPARCVALEPQPVLEV